MPLQAHLVVEPLGRARADEAAEEGGSAQQLVRTLFPWCLPASPAVADGRMTGANGHAQADGDGSHGGGSHSAPAGSGRRPRVDGRIRLVGPGTPIVFVAVLAGPAAWCKLAEAPLYFIACA